MNSLEIMYGIDKLKEIIFVIEKNNCYNDVRIIDLCKIISTKIQEEESIKTNDKQKKICFKILSNCIDNNNIEE